MTRHFLSQNDLTPAEVRMLLDRTALVKPVRYSTEFLGRSLVMFFEKPSTRTRLSFEVGMTQLGGHAVYLDRDSSQLSRGESIADTARVVSRYADLIMARVFSHETVRELATYATVPVINALSDMEHPCQTMADLFTMQECKGTVEGLKVAYVGDAGNNVARSLMLGVTQLGGHIRLAAPTSLQPGPTDVEPAERNAAASGGSVSITDDVHAAVDGADVVYTDVWVSMGDEADRGERLRALAPYQVNEQLVSRAQPDYIFMHCLPAHAGEEVTATVAYGPHSVIFDQAENRLHAQKALMLFLTEVSEGAQ